MISALSIGEILSVGSLTTLIGLSITFFTLILLVYVLNLMKKFNPKNTVTKEEPSQMPIAEIRQDNSVIAAITAAIAAMLNEEGAANKAKASFIVKSIKRI